MGVSGKQIGYEFSDPALLQAALTHASAQNEESDNERLEFLGDRVLGLAVADMLFKAFPGEKEGSLAKRHTALVQQETLVKVAAAADIAAHLTLSAGETKAGGHQKDKILADAVEALIGAIYLDGGFAPASEFVNRFWEPLLKAQEVPPEDAKSRLQEWAQGKGLPLPEYKQLSKSGPEHAPIFEIEVSVKNHGKMAASAANKRAAEKAAAQKMLDKIGKK